jgi:hypothetical protein
VAAAGVVADAALARGHHRDRARGFDAVLKGLDDAQRAQRVGDHDPGELLGRGLRDRALGLVGDTGVHEEQIEHPAGQARVQRRDLLGLGDVDGLDLDPAAGAVGEVVQLGPARAAHGGHDLPAGSCPLPGQRQAQTARGADQEHPPARGRRRLGLTLRISYRHNNDCVVYN